MMKENKLVRPLSSVNFDAAEKTKIIDDITKYLSPRTKSWYRSRGIPRRRVYLFHGPPGTGKSSLAATIAGHFKTDIYTLSLTDLSMNDRLLLSLLNEVPEGSVLLLEDIDSAGIKRENGTSTYNRRSNVTLSGLLNALDGASAPEGNVITMSTNAPDALDPALVRAGRVDCSVEFKNANNIAATEVFVRMMCDDEDDEKNNGLQAKAEEFVQHIPTKPFYLPRSRTALSITLVMQKARSVKPLRRIKKLRSKRRKGKRVRASKAKEHPGRPRVKPCI